VISEHHLQVRRTARLVTLGEPVPSVRHVWLACHGYGQLASRFMRRFEALDDGSRWIVAPEGLNRFYIESSPGPHGPGSKVGATWMTREDRLTDIDDCVAYLDAVHAWMFDRVDRDAVMLNVIGFSQGMSTVVRWAVRTAARIDHLALWAGSWPPEIEPSADLFGGARLSLVAGTLDRSVPPASANQLAARLAAAGLDANLEQFEGGHDIDAEVVRRLETRAYDEPLSG
jgi:predicted esterase